MKSQVKLTTSDEVIIIGNLYGVVRPKGWLLLVHMMPATKESWHEFAEAMQKEGYESIAVDLRGHGESEEGPNGYKNFSDSIHRSSSKDLDAAWKFLKERGAMPDKTVLIGASIGANLCLQFVAENHRFKKVALLSPGLNYRGIEAKPLTEKLKDDQAVMIFTSIDDGDNAGQNNVLYDAISIPNKKLIVYKQGGHGTSMLATEEEPNIYDTLRTFVLNESNH